MRLHAASPVMEPLWLRALLMLVGLGFIAVLVLLPVIVVFAEALHDGIPAYLDALKQPDAISAVKLTLLVAAIAVPCNVVFGVTASWAIAKFDFVGKQLLLTFIDLPFSVSPVISGLIYILLFGAGSVLSPFLSEHHIDIVFALPGLVIATIFVTFPFVARELIPLMQEQGTEEEEAAIMLGASGLRTFFAVTLPNIKWALLYGVLLCNARAMGEFGAVSVVSGHIRGKTNTIPLHVEILYNEYNFVGAFAVASILTLLALVTLLLKTAIEFKFPSEKEGQGMTIEVRNVRRDYGDFAALNDVSLKVADGELVALLGPSGSGKTTLLRIIAGLDFADAGQVLIDGKQAGNMHVKERRVGFVFQHYALFKHMTVFDNVAFGLKVRPKEVRPSVDEIRDRVMALLKLVHLDKFYDRYPSQLSGGQRQRVALARSLAVEPKLLLLDEPFGALDAKVRKELRRWLRRLHDDIHITSIFVTHDQEEAMEVADRVVVMNQGKIEQVGTPEEVYHSPVNGFVYDFLGNFNEFAGWNDEHGNMHLAEDDLWEAAPAAPTANATRHHWLGRYPELVGAIRKVMPGLPLPMDVPKTAAARARIISRAELAKRGTPVRVFARPHEMFVTKTPDDGHEYIPVEVIHINPAGSLAKIEMQRQNGAILQAEIPKNIVDSLSIQKHDRVFVRPKNVRVFV